MLLPLPATASQDHLPGGKAASGSKERSHCRKISGLLLLPIYYITAALAAIAVYYITAAVAAIADGRATDAGFHLIPETNKCLSHFRVEIDVIAMVEDK